MAAKSARREYVALAVIAAALITAVLLVRQHSQELTQFIETRPALGVLLYLVLNVLDAILLPGATLPLIPVASRAWGHVPAALITMAGWTAGSLLAFLIARRWGYPLVRKITSIERVKRLKKYIPKNLFWSVVLMRIVMPMDVISYVLGLFTDMSWRSYTLATILGLAPCAFMLAYLGKLPQAYELITFGIAVVAVLMVIFTVHRGSRKPAVPRFAKAHSARH